MSPRSTPRFRRPLATMATLVAGLALCAACTACDAPEVDESLGEGTATGDGGLVMSETFSTPSRVTVTKDGDVAEYLLDYDDSGLLEAIVVNQTVAGDSDALTLKTDFGPDGELDGLTVEYPDGEVASADVLTDSEPAEGGGGTITYLAELGDAKASAAEVAESDAEPETSDASASPAPTDAHATDIDADLRYHTVEIANTFGAKGGLEVARISLTYSQGDQAVTRVNEFRFDDEGVLTGFSQSEADADGTPLPATYEAATTHDAATRTGSVTVDGTTTDVNFVLDADGCLTELRSVDGGFVVMVEWQSFQELYTWQPGLARALPLMLAFS